MPLSTATQALIDKALTSKGSASTADAALLAAQAALTGAQTIATTSDSQATADSRAAVIALSTDLGITLPADF